MRKVTFRTDIYGFFTNRLDRAGRDAHENDQ